MKFIGSVFCVLCLVLSWSCKNGQAKVKPVSDNKEAHPETTSFKKPEFPLQINSLKEYGKKSLVFEELADVEYIPLETSKEVLLTGLHNGLAISDSLIVTFNRESSVFVFNRKGRLLHRFNHSGRGPGEYQAVMRIAVDFDANEIYVFDYPLRYKIWVYSMTGDFKRSLNLPSSIWIDDFASYDEKNLLVYINKSSNVIKNHKGPFRPYYLMSKRDGTLKQLDFEVAEIKDGKIARTYKADGQNRRSLGGLHSSPIARNGDDFFISDFASDTIYSFNHGKRAPYMINSPSLQNLENPLLVRIGAKTTRFTFLTVAEFKKGTTDFNRRFIGVDHKTGEIFEPDFQGNDFIQRLENDFYTLPAECVAVSIPALKLLDAFQKGKLTGKLKEIASKLEDDSNPVVMLLKFKK